MTQEIKADDDIIISKKIKRREDYGFYFDFLKNPILFFEQKPSLSFLPGAVAAFMTFISLLNLRNSNFIADLNSVSSSFVSEFQLFQSFILSLQSVETILILTALSFFLPYIYFEEKHQKRIETAEEKLPGFLHGLSDLIAGGLTLQEALTEISKDSNQKVKQKINQNQENQKNNEKLNKKQNQRTDQKQNQKTNQKKNRTNSFFENEIHLIGLKMKSGIPFDVCLDNFGKRYDSKLIQRAASVISAAEKSGGLMHLSIDAAVFDIQENVNLKKERDSKQSVYGVVLFISFLLFIGIAILLILQFGSMNALTNQASSFESDYESAVLIYRMLLIQGFFAGLMIGKLKKGNIAAGLKYSFAMMILVWISFTAGGVFPAA
ncbi:hypothetical protein [Methanimicrococcus hongohii]|nr:hypothetical protein [Methanimicrococcus sp. Hf6]